eukprot:jgi/Ulvmu1/594/UM001_0602.1
MKLVPRLRASPRIPAQCRAEPNVSARRDVLLASGSSLAGTLHSSMGSAALADEPGSYVNMEALKGKDYGKSPMKFTDYDTTSTGVQYKDLRIGSGDSPKEGDLCVIDWQGYTIGYYGRIFEARNKPKGSSFTGNDKDYLRLRLGESKMIPAVQDALMDMKVGGVRRLIIPEDAGYPNGDYKTYQPSPTTFAGVRTLDFVLKSKGFIDKTLLIDIELLKVA